MSNNLEMLKKLHALSKIGIGGEKENATRMLKAFMEKHGFTESDLGNDKLTERKFKVLKDDRRLVCQIIYSVVGDRTIYILTNFEKQKYVYRTVELTDAEFIEISIKIDFYLEKYKQDMEIFRSAFIQKNHLYPLPKEGDEDNNWSGLSREQKERHMAVSMMSQGLKKHELQKQIGV